MKRVLIMIVLSLGSVSMMAQSFTAAAPTIAPAGPYCSNANVTANWGISGTFNLANNFIVEMSDSGGSFASPTTLGTVAGSTNATSAPITMPVVATTTAGFRIRIRATSPATNSSNSASFTINQLTMPAPTFAGTTFCQGIPFTVNYTVTNSCNFSAGNTFTAQLSDNAGAFGAPINIGSVSAVTNGTISVTLPSGTGPGYRIRIVSSAPVVNSASSVAITINALGINAPTAPATTYCQGNSFNVTYTLPASCSFNAGNIFTAQLSDNTGAFGSPTIIGTATATTGGTIPVTIPVSAGSGTGYKIRVISSNPVLTGAISAATFTINALGINAPTVAASPYCQGQNISVVYTIQNSCTFSNTPANNIFTAQLSDAAGSFASPVNIGTITSVNSGTISAAIPVGTPAGAGYRIRVVSSNPGTIIGADNGANLTINAAAGDPTIIPTTAWNAYVYNANSFINYSGFYTENNLSFTSISRFPAASSPATADASSGAAYTGCPLTNPNVWGIIYKRTNFPCGYYQFTIPTHDDILTVLVDGVTVLTAGCCAPNLTAYTGFLGPASVVEIRTINTGSGGNISATFTVLPNPIATSPDVTICDTASTPLTATAPVTLSNAWTPLANLSPADGLGAVVTASPTASTLYTVTGTDPITGCSLTKNVNVTVSNATPTIGIVASGSTTICSGIAQVTLTASGANTYTWSPATNIISTSPSGHQITIANLGTPVTYTVTGSNGCSTGSNSILVTGETIPPLPAPTTFGSGQWNAYCYNGTSIASPYYGYYTEAALSFTSTTKWNVNNGPTVANPTYTGCTFGGTNYTISLKRTNFTCNYFQINIPYHDDAVTVFVDGVQVFQHNGCCDAHTAVWTGFLGAASTVEIQVTNNSGPGRIDAAIVPATASPVTVPASTIVCTGTLATLQATSTVAGATFSWVNGAGNTSNIATPNAATSFAGPIGVNENFTVTITDPLTTCTKSAVQAVTVSPALSLSVTPTTINASCPGQGPYTITASGASAYNWTSSPAGFTSTNFQIFVNPSVTTTYTVSGSNNCTFGSVSATINIPPIPSPSVFPTGTWNVYGFNSQTIGTNFVGYYTDNGSGVTGYDFNTQTRWTSGTAPSGANATNGTAWLGCPMNASNISLSFKRTGFTCGIYQIDIPTHDDAFTLIINGVTVAQHNGCCDTHTNMWTGVLNASSTVEFTLVQGGGGSYLSATFTPLAQSPSTIVWNGSVSNDWFNSNNWCYSSTTIPTNLLDVLIPSGGPPNMPAINGAGAVARNIQINGAVAAGTYTNLIPVASLSFASANNLDVHGNWLNNGVLTPGAGSVTFTGSNSGNTIVAGSTQTFNNLIINKTNGITNSSGTSQVAGGLIFTTGVLTQNASLVVLASGSTSGASDASHIDGPIAKVGNSAFVFPTGRGGLLHTIEISAPAVITDVFTARYFNTNPNGLYPITSKDVTLNRVSAVEYWWLNRTTGSSNVSVTLNWNTNSFVGNPPNLRVARWDGAVWRDHGNGAIVGNTVRSSGAIATFLAPNSPFTLGSTDASNPLPISLLSFTGASNGSSNILKWTTETEVNSDYFDVEKLMNGEKFATIGTVKAQGNSVTRLNYAFEDIDVIQPISYYRLKMTDADKTFVYSKIISVQADVSSLLTISPNPTPGKVTVQLSQDTIAALSVMDLNGKVLVDAESLSVKKYDLDFSLQTSGTYLVRVITAGNKVYIGKIVVIK